MDIQESTSVTSPVKSEPKDLGDEEVTASPGSKGDSQEAEEECAVCRNGMVDVTSLSDCVHQFCYDCIVGWLTHGSGQFCPMCKAPVKYVKKKDSEEITTAAEILAAKAPAPTIARDLITEKRMVARKMRGCRRMMNRLDELIAINNRQRNEARQEELQRMKQLVVAQLNSLQMLREDMEAGAVKSMIVSKVAFRRLIYERNVEVDGIPRALIRKPTSQDILQDIEHFRTVFVNFMSVELKALPSKFQMKVDNEHVWHFVTVHDEIDGRDEETINAIFDVILRNGVTNLLVRHIEAQLPDRISMRVACVLHGEIVSLLSSRMSFLEWCGAVTYRWHLDRGGEVNDDGSEVVVVDDTIDEPSEQRDFSRRRFAPFDRVFDLGQPSILFNRPPEEPSSDSDQDDPMYFQAPLRLHQPTSSVYRPQAHVVNPSIPRAGIPWDQLTGTATGRETRSRARATKPVQFVNLEDDEEEEQPSRSSSPDDIQVVDQNGTIILGDTPEVSGKRKRTLDRKEEEERVKRSKMGAPKELVEDVGKLIEKYEMSAKEALNLMVSATQKALDQKKNNASEEIDVES